MVVALPDKLRFLGLEAHARVVTSYAQAASGSHAGGLHGLALDSLRVFGFKYCAALSEQGWRVSSTTVSPLLRRPGYRLQSVRKRQEGAAHPDRRKASQRITFWIGPRGKAQWLDSQETQRRHGSRTEEHDDTTQGPANHSAVP